MSEIGVHCQLSKLNAKSLFLDIHNAMEMILNKCQAKQTPVLSIEDYQSMNIYY